MSNSSAARTNLSSLDVTISNKKLGEGIFRVCLEGTYRGGNRNGQEAACKRFKPQFRGMETEFFAADFQIADKAIEFAEQWNDFCEYGKEILISRGYIHKSNSGIPYLVEPVIRYYTKYTSNSGWIADNSEQGALEMEAFSHFTYHASGGSLLVCDLQGRYRFNRYNRSKCRFELADPAICSRSRKYGPTDLGEKGIHSFFSNHVCNRFCEGHWTRPRYARQWFPQTRGTSMLSSRISQKLNVRNPATFRLGMNNIMEDDSSSDDSW
jgi:hypothetical protein